jgi:aconitate hydratase
VIAYAPGGCISIDIDADPVATDPQGRPSFCASSGPTMPSRRGRRARRHPRYLRQHGAIESLAAGELGRHRAPSGVLFQWDRASTYIVEPPFFADHNGGFAAAQHVSGARVLGIFGDALTTDHISPEAKSAGQPGRRLSAVDRHPACRFQ